jgi:hypothetical protein
MRQSRPTPIETTSNCSCWAHGRAVVAGGFAGDRKLFAWRLAKTMRGIAPVCVERELGPKAMNCWVECLSGAAILSDTGGAESEERRARSQAIPRRSACSRDAGLKPGGWPPSAGRGVGAGEHHQRLVVG